MAPEAAFDYVIVGAGSAGCVLAARLSEDRANRVLLLEAGGADEGALLEMPLRWFEAMRTPRIGWAFTSETEPFADNRRIPAPRGKVLGGCSSINGMMYSRGNPADYDEWASRCRSRRAAQGARRVGPTGRGLLLHADHPGRQHECAGHYGRGKGG